MKSDINLVVKQGMKTSFIRFKEKIKRYYEVQYKTLVTDLLRCKTLHNVLSK